MATDSREPGYLRPAGAAPPYDKDLEDIFHDVIQGITGLPGNLIRPRYQVNPANQPQADQDWSAFGVTVERQDWQSYRALSSDGERYLNEVTEAIRVNVSFYGPRYQHFERMWCDGMQIEQNRDGLAAHGIAFIEFADPVALPALLKEQWVKRADVRGLFHRKAVREYPIRDIVGVGGDSFIDNEKSLTPIVVNPPPSP